MGQPSTQTGGMGISKHRKVGYPVGDNRAAARHLNRESEHARKVKDARRGPMYGSVRELFSRASGRNP
jgi:hypothetical protein